MYTQNSSCYSLRNSGSFTNFLSFTFLLCSLVLQYRCWIHYNRNQWGYYSTFLLFSFVLILALALLIRMFNKKPLKYMITENFLLLNCITLVIILVIATYWFALPFIFIQMVLYFMLSILIVSLNTTGYLVL